MFGDSAINAARTKKCKKKKNDFIPHRAHTRAADTQPDAMDGNEQPRCMVLPMGLFASSCGASVTLNNCTPPAFDGVYDTRPRFDILPIRSLNRAALRIISQRQHGGSAAIGVKALKMDEPEHHQRVWNARVTSVLPLLGTCQVAVDVALPSPSPVLISPWLDQPVPCAQVIRSPNEHQHDRVLRSSVEFFVGMVFSAKLVDTDHWIDGWLRPTPAESVDQNILCRDCSGNGGSGGGSKNSSSSVADSWWECQPIMHHDFDAAVDLAQPSRALDHLLTATAHKRAQHGMEPSNSTAALVQWFLFSQVTWPALLLDAWPSAPSSAFPSAANASVSTGAEQRWRTKDLKMSLNS